jgi:Helix-turn-helix domain
MSWQETQKVWERDFAHPQKLVLLALADCTPDGGLTYPSVARIAMMTGYSDRHIKRLLDGLEDTGVLVKEAEAPGQGKEMTVWCNAKHVFIEFNIPGHAHANGNTEGPNHQNGFRLNSTWPPPEGPAGFTARHWKGT